MEVRVEWGVESGAGAGLKTNLIGIKKELMPRRIKSKFTQDQHLRFFPADAGCRVPASYVSHRMLAVHVCRRGVVHSLR